MLPISGCAGKPEPAERKPNSVNKTAGRGSAKPGSGRQNSAPPLLDKASCQSSCLIGII